MEYVGKISKSITANCRGRNVSVFYLGDNVFSIGIIYNKKVYSNK